MPEEIWGANRAPALSALLAKTAWPSNWQRVLRRLPGAKVANNGKACWFTDGLRSKGTSVPKGFVMDANEAEEPY